MNWNDCEVIWKRQPLPLGEKADVGELRRRFDEKHRKMAAAIFARDVAEAGAALLVAAVIGFLWWKTGTHGWPFGLALLLVLGVGGVFVRERVRARRSPLGPDAPLLTKVAADIAELRHQRELLLRMRTWYLGPVFAAGMVVSLVITIQSSPWSVVRSPWFQLVFTGGYLLLSWFAWIVNRREIRQRIDPRITELEKLHADLRASA
jgi:MFS family permease